MSFEREADVAREAALAGGEVIARHASAERRASWQKSDDNPVTGADLEANAAIVAVLRAAFPDDALLSEETIDSPARLAASRVWIVDPLDGTRTFVRGVPLYGTLVGLEVRGDPVVGVVYLPALDELVAAAQGLGCAWNGRPCRVSSIDRLDQALVAVTDERNARQRSGAYARLAEASGMQRTWADCYAYVLVATGRAEVALDPIMNVWDCAALLPIVEEAGGRFSDWRGTRTIHGGEAVATNGVLHDRVLGLLAERGSSGTSDPHP